MIDIENIEKLSGEFAGLEPGEAFLKQDSTLVNDIGSALLRGYGEDALAHIEDWQQAEGAAQSGGLQLVVTDTVSWWRTGSVLHLVGVGALEQGVAYTGSYRRGFDRRLTTGKYQHYPSGIITKQAIPASFHVTRKLVDDEVTGTFDRASFSTPDTWYGGRFNPLELNLVESALTNSAGDAVKEYPADNKGLRVSIREETKLSKTHPVVVVRKPDVQHITSSAEYSRSIYDIMMYLKASTTSIRPKSKGHRNLDARERHRELPITNKQIREIVSREMSDLFDLRKGTLGAVAAEDVLFCIEQLGRQAMLEQKTRDD